MTLYILSLSVPESEKVQKHAPVHQGKEKPQQAEDEELQ
jgi:hypothetical protein